ncbi:MAG TPA: ArsA family ATPase [Pseudonocardiaceae bacterium]|nr:ArsA family ATPase [Pseudonocardiaceae bacterium]
MRILLFTGKGGVGKTTLAAATAARLAERGSKTLVVSTDPAHSLSDALGVPLTGDPTELGGDAPEGLYASQLDTRRLVDGNWLTLRGHLRGLLSGAGVDDIAAEELTVLPGVEELLALTEVYRLAETGPWEAVVVDCGPTAETLRLLALPEAVSGYLEKLFPSHRRAVRGLLAGLAGVRQADRLDDVADAIGRLAEQLDGLRRMLGDRRRTGVRLVCTPERVVVAETRRTLSALALQGIRVDGLIANRMVPELSGRLGVWPHPAVSWLRARRVEQQAVLRELADTTALAVHTAPYLAAEPIGAPALLVLAEQLYGERDPLAEADVTTPPLLSVRGQGHDLDSRFELRVAVPLAADTTIDLARVDDDLALTVDGRRRLITLPAVLRRCQVLGAEVDEEGLLVRFQPDPQRWMRQEGDR